MGPRRMRFGVAIAGLTAVAMATVGCSSAPSGSAEATTGELSFYTDKAAWKPDFDKLNDTSNADVKITVKTTGYSDAAQYDAFIKQSFRTDKTPGLFTWHTGDSLKQLVDQKLIAETTAIWDKAISNGWVSEDIRRSYTYNGKQYCVPMNVVYWVMYYNKHIFDEHKVSVPTTWKDLEAVANKLKGKGVTPFWQTSTLFTFPWFQHLVASTDPNLYAGLTNGSVKYTDPRIVKLMNMWLDEQKAGWFTDAGNTTDPMTAMKQGNYAMSPFGTFFTGALKGAGLTSGTDYGIFIIPSVNPALDSTPIALESGPLCTAANSPQKALGLAYSEWFMSPGAQTTWGGIRGDVAYNPKSTVSDPLLKELGNTVRGGKYPLYDRYIEAMPTAVSNVAIEQFGAFNAKPGDPLPVLQAIQAAADKYWAGK